MQYFGFIIIIDNSDYQDTGVRSFLFNSSQTTFNISIPLINDTVYELTELFGASLGFSDEGPSRVTFEPATAEVHIFDDDGEKNDNDPGAVSHVISY